MRTLFAIVLFFAILTPATQKTQAQVKVTDSQLANHGNTFIQIYGDLHLAQNAQIHNESEIFIYGDLINNSGSGGFVLNSLGTVHFSGNHQRISGSDETTFDHLVFSGNDVKSIETNVFVHESLDISDMEIDVEENILHLKNTDPLSLLTNGGFISASGNGRFIRDIESTDAYYFPLGSTISTERYRPLSIQAETADFDEIHARFVNNSPDDDQLDTSLKDTLLTDLNNEWYHLIGRTNGTQPLNVDFFFLNTTDGNFDAVAQWNQTDNEWQFTGNLQIVSNPEPDFSVLTLTAWTDFSEEAFALANLREKDTATYTRDLQVFELDVFPNPTSDKISVQLDQHMPGAILRIYDGKGSLMHTETLFEKSNEISLQNLAEGIYFIQIEHQSFVASERIILHR